MCIVEPRPRLGEGVAYSTQGPSHLLNVRAGGMSVFDDDPGHFVRYLEAQPDGAAAGADSAARVPVRAPRDVCGLLAQHSGCLREALTAALARGGGGRDRCDTIRTGAALRPEHPRFCRRFRDGEHAASAGGLVAADARDALIHAWDYPAVAIIPAGKDVCLVGSGLSMVDVAMTLRAIDHRGRIRVLSRSRAFAAGTRAGARSCGRHRRCVCCAPGPMIGPLPGSRGKGRWICSGRTAEQRRFLRHARTFWDIHRHRIAPEVASRLRDMRRSGQPTVHAGSVESIEAVAEALRIGFRPRGGTRTRTGYLHAGRVVTCVGIETWLRRMRHPLMSLAARDRSPGPLGLGLAIGNAAGVPVDADGRLQPMLSTVGRQLTHRVRLGKHSDS